MEIIERCDTFFLTTYFPESKHIPDYKVDISHRGGQPGFLRILDDHTLIWPEYPGNNMFMTLGNIYGNPRISLLVMDFNHNALLQLSGTAQLLLSLPLAMKAMDGMNKFVQFTITESIHFIANALPFAFQLVQPSPYNPSLRGFQGMKHDERVTKQQDAIREKQPNLQLEEVIAISEEIASFRFSTQMNFSFFPGQYVMIHWKIPELDFDGIRSWTITSIPSSKKDSERSLQITIKRVGLITNWLFREFNNNRTDSTDITTKWKSLLEKQIFEAELVSIQGNFSVFSATESSTYRRYQFRSPSVEQVVFLSAGIGMTPFLAMVKGILRSADNILTQIKIQWYISVRKPVELNVLFDLMNDISLRTSRRRIELIVHITEPSCQTYYPMTLNQHYHLLEDRLQITQVFSGRLDEKFLLRNCTAYPKETDFYICGPTEYMKMVSNAIPKHYHNRIFTEDFYF